MRNTILRQNDLAADRIKIFHPVNRELMKMLVSIMLLIQIAVKGQSDGTITIRKPPLEDSCHCVANKLPGATSVIRIRLLRNENFKNHRVSCFTVRIYQGDLLLTCATVAEETMSTTVSIPAGRYDVMASADDQTLSTRDIIVTENKTTVLSFEFRQPEIKDKKKPKRRAPAKESLKH